MVLYAFVIQVNAYFLVWWVDVLGNRGRCAQPCRLPYSLIAKSNCNINYQTSLLKKQSLSKDKISSNKEELINRGYLLSPKDLCGLEYLPSLIHAGVTCFKIEGRLKSPEYVATVTRIYRKYIDKVLQNKEYIIEEQDKKDLIQVFNRGGFSTGHLGNLPNRDLIFKQKPNNMGIDIGTVENYNANKGHIKLQLKDSLSIGDTISFEKEPSKYTISELMSNNTNYTTMKAGQKATIGRMKGNISVGNKVYKMASKELSLAARQSYETVENKKILINCIVTIKKDIPMSMQIICTNARHGNDNYHNIKVTTTSNVIPTEALNAPLTMDRVQKQISKTGNTPFAFENISIDMDDNIYIPSISSLNELRRTSLEMLEAKVIANKNRNCNLDTKSHTSISSIKVSEHPEISLFLRTLSTAYDYHKLNKEKVNKIYLSLKLFVNKNHSETIKYLAENYDLYIYMPTIIKANYRNIILNSLEEILEKYHIKGFIISNIADFKILEKYKNNYDLFGNYSLNVFNQYTLKEYEKLGLNRITLSRELNEESLQKLLNNSNTDEELIVYGNLPIMAMNYCLLGKTNKCYPNCGMNCQKNKTYYLKDRLGYEFRIISDNLQTVTLICNSKTLSIPTKNIPINHVRVDTIDETIEEINHIIDVTYNREKLEGEQYTNGNLHREV